MRNRIWLAAGGSVLAASISLAGAATAASASTAGPSTVSASKVVGYTYLDGNTATSNTIDGFARHADGSITQLPGSPFAAGGAGLGTGLASQGAIQATRAGRRRRQQPGLGAAHQCGRRAGPGGPAGVLRRGQAGQRGGLALRPGLCG
jgi:hypothetical protein